MTPTLLARAILFVVFVVVTAGVGCVHQTTYLSEPPGAEVSIDGVVVGQTPVTIDETTGPSSYERVEVRHPATDDVARFDVEKTAFHTEMLIVGFLAGVGTFFSAALMMGPFFAAYISILTLASIGPFAGIDPFVLAGSIAGLAVILYGSYIAAILLASSAPTVAIATIGEGARSGPDEIHVDFETGETYSSPNGMIVPLVGAPSGKRGVKLHTSPDGDEDNFTDDDETP